MDHHTFFLARARVGSTAGRHVVVGARFLFRRRHHAAVTVRFTAHMRHAQTLTALGNTFPVTFDKVHPRMALVLRTDTAIDLSAFTVIVRSRDQILIIMAFARLISLPEVLAGSRLFHALTA